MDVLYVCITIETEGQSYVCMYVCIYVGTMYGIIDKNLLIVYTHHSMYVRIYVCIYVCMHAYLRQWLFSGPTWPQMHFVQSPIKYE